ncbi:hypothetical protein [Staphylococcus aureus]|uniref:hypothetical protein n=1 Tax=Staphylococcus aureus TaxID=1280 RepID=UPI00115E922E|nr:hypothetical protein [Staphylococcus aureus]
MKKGQDGKDGKSITITSQRITKDGSTVIEFSDGNSVTIPKGQDGHSVTVKEIQKDNNGNTVIIFSDDKKSGN